jgi:hypothetical protein
MSGWLERFNCKKRGWICESKTTYCDKLSTVVLSGLRRSKSYHCMAKTSWLKRNVIWRGRCLKALLEAMLWDVEKKRNCLRWWQSQENHMLKGHGTWQISDIHYPRRGAIASAAWWKYFKFASKGIFIHVSIVGHQYNSASYILKQLPALYVLQSGMFQRTTLIRFYRDTVIFRYLFSPSSTIFSDKANPLYHSKDINEY